MERKPSDHPAPKLVRATHQNAFMLLLAFAAARGGLAYSKLRIELWLAGVLLLALVVNLIRVARVNRASPGRPPRD
jgi:hypothetical protein